MTRIVQVVAGAALALAMTSIQGADAQQQETNKRNVVEFYEKALNQKDFDAASRYLGPRYTQHNPVAADIFKRKFWKGITLLLREKLSK